MNNTKPDHSTQDLLAEIARLQEKVAELEAEKSSYALQASSNEQAFKTLVENSPDVISRHDRKLRHTYVNPAIERATGIPAKEFIGKTHEDLGILIGKIDRWKAAIKRVFDTGQPEVVEFVFPTPTGLRNYQSRLVPELGPDGGIEAVLNVARDVTEFKEVEEKLRNSRDHFEKIFRLTPTSICITSLHTGCRLDVNDEFLHITGYNREELIGFDSGDAVWADRSEYLRYLDILHSTGFVNAMEAQLRDKNGRIHPGLLTAEVITLDGEECVLRMFMDLTERKEAERKLMITQEKLRQSQEQLLQASKLESIGRLAGGISHDFNNLLTAISGYGDLMLMSMEQDNPFYSNVSEILKATDRAAQLTHQLLAFSRQQVLQPKVINLNTIIVDISRMLERLIGEHIELTTNLEKDLRPVLADPSQFEQVLVNLAVNSRDAMPNGGQVFIETENIDLVEDYALYKEFYLKPGNYVRLAFSDNGTGMNLETKSHIFEPFFTTKAQGKGTGLGLATVYGIVKQSDGYIWVYSEPGVGTTFKIYLPAVMTADVAAEPVAPVIPTDLRGTETVMLVEDDETVRNLAIRAFNDNGYRVLTASNGQEALELLEEYSGPLDLILTDVIMPKMGGRDLIEKLTTLHPGLKVIFISGYTDWAVEHRAFLKPGQAFLQKPFTTSHLIRKVRQALDNPLQ